MHTTSVVPESVNWQWQPASPLWAKRDLQEGQWCSLGGVNPLYVNLKDQLEFPEFTPWVYPPSYQLRDCEKQYKWTQNKTRLTWLQVSLWTWGFFRTGDVTLLWTVGMGGGGVSAQCSGELGGCCRPPHWHHTKPSPFSRPLAFWCTPALLLLEMPYTIPQTGYLLKKRGSSACPQFWSSSW